MLKLLFNYFNYVFLIVNFLKYFRTANTIEAPSGTQAYAAKQITNEFFPDHSGEKSVYAFFHNTGREKLDDVECLSHVVQNLVVDIQNFEDAHNRKLIAAPLQSCWLTNVSALKDNLMSENKNGTMVFIELVTDGQQRYDDYKDIDQMIKDRISTDCTKEEQNDFVYGMMGQYALEMDSQVSLLFVVFDI